ncbi:hypothetical protein BH24PSE2_BH24PSE2_12960 [soil metagenome]
MDDTSKLVQVIAALSLAVAFFLFSYFASPRKTVPWLICLSPFQTIDNPYATSSVLLTYVIGIAFLLRGKLRFLPMLGFFALVLAIYAVSTGFQHEATHVQHGIYIFNYVSAILMFYVVYNFVRETRDVDLILRTLVILNVLVAIYCVIQLLFDKVSLFGIEELTIQGTRLRGADPRLTGPYGVGVTAEFLVIHTLLAAYLLVHANTALKRYLLYGLMAVNIGCLLATANRGGFLVLVGGAGLFLFMFRSQLGMKRTLTLAIGGSFVLVVASIIIVNFTNYGAMYDRLEATELEGGVPDTRAQSWAAVIPGIFEKPLLGHGPRLRLQDDSSRRYPGHEAIPYPHNLYLFLLHTVGFAGLAVYVWFFAWLVVRIRRALPRLQDDDFTRGLVKLGILLIIVIVVDQMKIDFLRFELVDYWHYLFSLFALWLGMADMVRAPAPQTSGFPAAEKAPEMGRAATSVTR